MMTENKYLLIDTKNNIVGKYLNGNVKNFNEGLAPVELNYKWGYIDKKGNIKIDYQFDNALPFTEGLAAIEIDGKWGYINSKGKSIISCQFLEASIFKEGYAFIMHYPDYSAKDPYAGCFVLIDKKGRVIKKLESRYGLFSEGYSLRNGVYR